MGTVPFLLKYLYRECHIARLASYTVMLKVEIVLSNI